MHLTRISCYSGIFIFDCDACITSVGILLRFEQLIPIFDEGFVVRIVFRKTDFIKVDIKSRTTESNVCNDQSVSKVRGTPIKLIE